MFVRLGSHRCRQKVDKILGSRQNYYSMHRETGHGGCIDVTTDEWEKIKGVTGVSRLRPPFDDLHPCIPWH